MFLTKYVTLKSESMTLLCQHTSLANKHTFAVNLKLLIKIEKGYINSGKSK